MRLSLKELKVSPMEKMKKMVPVRTRAAAKRSMKW